MKLTVVRGGGIAGLVTTTSADSDALPPEQAEALRTKVEGSGLMQLPARVAGPTTHPDAFDYEVTIEDGDRTQRVSLSEDAVPPSVRSLISWLDSVPGRQERIAPPGPAGNAGPERPDRAGNPGPERPDRAGNPGPG